MAIVIPGSKCEGNRTEIGQTASLPDATFPVTDSRVIFCSADAEQESREVFAGETAGFHSYQVHALKVCA